MQSSVAPRSPNDIEPGGPLTAGSRLRRTVDWAQRFLFGDDVFVSYARADATTYALGLANELARRELSCFVDQWGTPPGDKLPEPLLRALRKSTMFVLVGTAKAAVSDSVRHEVEAFITTGRPITPIDFDGALQAATWFPVIRGLSLARESKAALETGRPSYEVVSRIVAAEGFTRRNKRLRMAFWSTIAAIGVLAAAGGMLIAYQMDRAESATTRANAETMRAEAASESEQTSRKSAAEADVLRRRAESMAQMAINAESTARASADEQRRIARALTLANQATAAFDETAEGLVTSSLLAVESLQLAWTREGYAAWLRSMRLLPHAPVSRIGPARGAISAVAMSRDGRRAAVSDTTGMVLVHDLPTGNTADSLTPNVPWQLLGHAVALSPDGRWLSAGESDPTAIVVREVGTGRRDTLRTRCEDSVHGAAFGAARTTLLALTCAGRMPRLFSFEGSAWQEVVLRPDSGSRSSRRVLAVALSPNARWLAEGSTTGLVLWNVSTGAIATRDTARAELWTLAFSPDGRRIAGRDGTTAWLWQVSETQDASDASVRLSSPVRWSIPGAGGAVWRGTVAFSPDGRVLFTGGETGNGRLWDVETRREMRRLIGVAGAAAFTIGDGGLLGGLVDGRIGRWSPDHLGQGAEATRLRLGVGARTAAFSPDGRWLAVGDERDTTQVFETASWRETKRVAGGRGGVGFTRDGRWLVTIGPSVRVYAPGTWRRVGAFAGPTRGDADSASVSPDGQWLVTWNHSSCARDRQRYELHEILVWNIASAREVAWDRAVCPSNNTSSDTLPSGKGGRTALVSEATSWQRVAGEEPGEYRSPDASWLAVRSDSAVMLQEGPTGRPITQLFHDRGAVRGLAFSPDGTTIATAGDDGTVRLWLVAPSARDQLVRQLCARLVGRRLTPADWRRFLPEEARRPTCPGPVEGVFTGARR